MRRFICTCLAAMAIWAGAMGSEARADGLRTEAANFFTIASAQEFSRGQTSGLAVTEEVAQGALMLSPGQMEGEYVSEEIAVPAFEYLVTTWNCDTPDGTQVEVFARAFVDAHNDWTPWLSWGSWGQSIARASTNDKSDWARIDTDIFTVLGSDGETASRIQLKAVLSSDRMDATPVLRRLACTTKNTLEGQEIPLPISQVDLPERVLLDTPVYSQMIRDQAIASVICSPTTITTLLNDRGEDLLPEEVALNSYDFRYEGFGNWAFSLAAAGSYGYEAYGRYCDLDTLRQELAQGYSVGISVRYSTDPSSSIYVEGAPMDSSGHLITLRGYETVDGVDYFYVSDSAAGSDQAGLLRYRADHLSNAWTNRFAYIVHDKEKGAGEAATRRISAELRPSEEEGVYTLYAEGEPVELATSFTMAKTSRLGCGTLAYLRDDAVPTVAQEGTSVTTANKPFGYEASVTQTGGLRLDAARIAPDADGQEVALTVYVITNDGRVYVAPVTLGGPAGAPEREDSVPTVPVVEQSVQREPGGIYGPLLVVVGVSVVGLAVIALLLGRRR